MPDFMLLNIFNHPAWLWAVFFIVVIVLLFLDLGVLNRKDEEITVKRSLKLSAFYISMGLLFGVFVWQSLGAERAQEYYTGFIIEKTLSLDNIFVISLVFSYFSIPRKYQYRVLFWGIIGVLLLRAILIGIGAELVEDFSWMLDLFAVFLIYTGFKMLKGGEENTNIGDNAVLRTVKKYMRVTEMLHGNKFFITKKEPDSGGKVRFATPLFMALVVVECVDLIFALDSVPAIFAVTTDEYIVYTSNVFAILGLRALYFALSAMLHRFEYLKYSLSAVLIFIGGKVIVPALLQTPHLSSEMSLLITLGILALGVIYSMWKTKGNVRH